MKTRFILQSIVATLVLCGIFADTLQAQPSKPQTAQGTCYAILIGVNDYEHHASFQFCVNDMTGLKDALVKGKFATEDHITLLVSGAGEDLKPTRANIYRVLKNMAATTQENDTVLFAFSGNGICLPSHKSGTDFQQYLCPEDAKFVVNDDTGRFETESLLALAEIDRILTEVSKAKTQIMFLDACRNKEIIAFNTRSFGGMTSTTENGDLTNNLKSFAPALLAEKLETKGLYRFFGCDKEQKCFEDIAIKHGVFSFYLIEGLKGQADKKENGGNGDGKVTLDELKVYVPRETKNFVLEKFSANQQPTFSAMDTFGASPIMALCGMEKGDLKPKPRRPRFIGPGKPIAR